MAFGTDESVLFREVSLIQGVLIERFHCTQCVQWNLMYVRLNIHTTDGNLLDHSTEMSEIDARLNALQQFMKRSLEASAKLNSRKR